MKFPEIPGPPGRTPKEKFMDAVRHVMSVPKKEIDHREAEYQHQKRIKQKIAKKRSKK